MARIDRDDRHAGAAEALKVKPRSTAIAVA
jgi:hypothetical protein